MSKNNPGGNTEVVSLDNLDALTAATNHEDVVARTPAAPVNVEDFDAMKAATEEMEVIELGVQESEEALRQMFASFEADKS